MYINVPSDHELHIKVKPKGGSKGKAVGASKGPAKRSSKKTDDGRRRTSGSYIRLWDLGQISDGSGGWIDTRTQIHTTPIIAGDTLVPAALETSNYQMRDLEYINIDPPQLTSKARRITKGTLSSKYQITATFGPYDALLDLLSQWTDDGLKVEQTHLDSGLVFGSGDGQKPYFPSVALLDGNPNVKITANSDYTSPAVPFSPSQSMDVFMPPQMMFLRGRAVTTTFGDRGSFGELYLTLPRRFGINTSDHWYGGSPTPGQGMDAQTDSAISNWRGVLTSNREYFYDYSLDLWTFNSSFPPPSTIGKGVVLQGMQASVNGELLAIVKKGSSFYYFWTHGL